MIIELGHVSEETKGATPSPINVDGLRKQFP